MLEADFKFPTGEKVFSHPVSFIANHKVIRVELKQVMQVPGHGDAWGVKCVSKWRTLSLDRILFALEIFICCLHL